MDKKFQHTAARRRLGQLLPVNFFFCCFNTQPPEGGWANCRAVVDALKAFQHTAARRRLDNTLLLVNIYLVVSTHSRPKAAGPCRAHLPKIAPCFNTQPPEGGWEVPARDEISLRRFNTQPPEGGWRIRMTTPKLYYTFQHTAARRRLAEFAVPTDSYFGFNTQPPEGGWLQYLIYSHQVGQFQHTAA